MAPAPPHPAASTTPHRGDCTDAENRLRKTVRATLDLLDWLDGQEIDLAALTQHHLDGCLAEPIGSRRRYLARDFLKWAVTSRHTPRNVSLPALRTGQPTRFAEPADYPKQLQRCLHDGALKPDIRAAGALILLYGHRITDVLVLRSDQVIQLEDDHCLDLAGNMLLLPPPLAALLTQLPLPRNNNRTIIPPTGSSAPLLFPGFNHTRPLDSRAFGARLLRSGTTPHAGRNTAMMTLATDPARCRGRQPARHP